MANDGSNTVSVLMGNGDGTFGPQQTYAVGISPTSVAIADLNGDGKPDLVVTNEEANTVSVLMGNGDGTFQAQKTYAVGSEPSNVVAADLTPMESWTWLFPTMVTIASAYYLATATARSSHR